MPASGSIVMAHADGSAGAFSMRCTCPFSAGSSTYIAIVNEILHETRIVPLDGRPHLLHQVVRRHMGLHRRRIDGHRTLVELDHRVQILQYLAHGTDVLDIGDVVKDAGAGREK